MHLRKRFFIPVFILILIACGGKEKQASNEPLTEKQIRLGIGPIDTVELEPIDPKLVKRGQQIFRGTCMKCHTLDQGVLGPPLREVINNRTPEFIMNMILNPQENVMRHPVLQKYTKQYNNYMTDQGLDSTAARAILEYLRSEAP